MIASSLNPKSLWWIVVAVILAALLIYWPNPRMGYVLDDHYVIARNPVVKNPSAAGIFSSGLFDSAKRQTESKLNYYRPLLTASFSLDYKLWGLNPYAQRLVNAGIHVLNCLLVFALFYLLFGKAERAGIAAILFCVLPVHEWSVRYIVGRGDLLSAFFGLGSLTLLAAFIRNDKKILLWGSAAFFVGALLCKETAMLNIAYVFMTALFLTRQLRRTVILTSFFGLIAAAYYVARLKFLPINGGAPLDWNGIIQGISLGGDYVLRFLMPRSALVSVPYGFILAHVWFIGCLGLLYLGLIRSNEDRRDIPAVLLGVSWIFVGILQFAVIARIMERLGPVLSEHFLYFEAVGFVLLLAVMIEKIRIIFFRKAIFSGLVFYYIVLSMIGGYYWVNEETLLRNVQAVERQRFTVAYEQIQMRFDSDEREVMYLIERSKSAATQSMWYRRLGDIARSRGDYDKAKEALGKAVELNSMNIEAINELAVCHLEKGNPRAGIALLDLSITVDPRQSDVYRLYGVLFYRSGKFDKAVEYLNQSLDRDPDQSEAELYLMMAYYFLNDKKSYIEIVEHLSAHSLNPQTVLRFAARELFMHGYFQETVKVISDSAALFQGDPSMAALRQEAERRAAGLPK